MAPRINATEAQAIAAANDQHAKAGTP
jgi:hypothetical protein